MDIKALVARLESMGVAYVNILVLLDRLEKKDDSYYNFLMGASKAVLKAEIDLEWKVKMQETREIE